MVFERNLKRAVGRKKTGRSSLSYGPLPGEEWIEYEIPKEPRAHPPGMRFLGLNAMVTGAGRGFGKVIAEGLAAEGADLVITYNTSEEGAKKAAEQIRSKGRKAMTVKADIRNWAEVKSATEKVWTEFGPVDVLVNNAAEIANDCLSWRNITEESIDHTLDVDVKGTMLVTHEVGKRMFERKSGTIVNIASHVIAMGTPRAPQYAAGKEGLIGLTKSYALAFAPWVRVNAACPGWMATQAITNRADYTPRHKWIITHTPLRRLPKPEHIVPMILFLASDDSFHMTGNIIVADGGFTMPGA